MDDPHDAQPEQSPYLRLPWLLVAALLVAVLALALAIGLVANRNLQPQPQSSPTALSIAAPTLTRAPTAPATPTLTSLLVPANTVQQTITASSATMEPVPLPTLHSTSGSFTGPTAPVIPTIDPLLADEVGRSYQMFWRVRAQALLELDTRHLAEVMDDEYLQKFELTIQDLRIKGRAIKTQVSLNYVVAQAGGELAIVVDHVEDNSLYVTPVTLQPLTDPANDLLRLQFKLRKTKVGWKVVDSVSAD